LRPRVAGDVAGLVSIACDVRSAYVQFWRSVFERCAPQSTALVVAELGAELKQGNSTHEFPELGAQLVVVADAHDYQVVEGASLAAEHAAGVEDVSDLGVGVVVE
jgi:hypothetical protein